MVQKEIDIQKNKQNIGSSIGVAGLVILKALLLSVSQNLGRIVTLRNREVGARGTRDLKVAFISVVGFSITGQVLLNTFYDVPSKYFTYGQAIADSLIAVWLLCFKNDSE